MTVALLILAAWLALAVIVAVIVGGAIRMGEREMPARTVDRRRAIR